MKRLLAQFPQRRHAPGTLREGRVLSDRQGREIPIGRPSQHRLLAWSRQAGVNVQLGADGSAGRQAERQGGSQASAYPGILPERPGPLRSGCA